MTELKINNQFTRHECERFGLDFWETPVNETYGQCGEDIIADSFLRVQLFRSGRNYEQLKYIEIGANHPVVHSASYLFHKKYGAHGILVEPIPSLCETLSKHRPGDTVVNCVVSASHAETATLYVTKHQALSSLNRRHIELFAGDAKQVTDKLVVRNCHINSFMETYAPKTIDFLSVDTEGTDFEILHALDTERFRPTLIQCETSGDVMPFVEFFKTKSYILLAATNVNVFFADALAILGIPQSAL